jgi:hypothetical protein
MTTYPSRVINPNNLLQSSRQLRKIFKNVS